MVIVCVFSHNQIKSYADNWMDFWMVPTTVCKYGCVGYSEEEAADVFGEGSLRVYLLQNNPLETYGMKRTARRPTRAR